MFLVSFETKPTSHPHLHSFSLFLVGKEGHSMWEHVHWGTVRYSVQVLLGKAWSPGPILLNDCVTSRSTGSHIQLTSSQLALQHRENTVRISLGPACHYWTQIRVSRAPALCILSTPFSILSQNQRAEYFSHLNYNNLDYTQKIWLCLLYF